MTTSTSNPTATPLDVVNLRADFPTLARTIHDEKQLVYLDNAATSQKPNAVIDTIDRYYREHNANVHRGIHTLAEEATAAYEGARAKMQAYLNAADEREIVFTKGTTDAINLVASAWGRANLSAGDRVLITHLEHHSNIVPWQLVCEATGAQLVVADVTDAGEIDLNDLRSKLDERVKLVAVSHISNALGTINPVKQIAKLAHEAGALVLIDGAQGAPHGPIDVRDIDADFYALSGHKMYGPTGIGVLYGKLDLLAAMPPYQGGGDMIKSVSFDGTEFNDPPYRFEAGTPHIAGGAGLGAAVDYLTALDWPAIRAHEDALLAHGSSRLSAIDGLRLIGTASQKVPIFSFVLDGIAPYDASHVLDRLGVAVRIGHHCTEPLMKRFGLTETIRASAAMYNTVEELDVLADVIVKAQRMLA